MSELDRLLLVIRWARFSDEELKKLREHLDSQTTSVIAVAMSAQISELQRMRRKTPYDESRG